jgi:2-polyprenyl-3-methyl-5-hydroxy-6-metoxy-1,4-benzoquinol methylase
MFEELSEINSRPKPFEFYTASELWTDEHTSEQMLNYHLNPDVDLSSRNRAFIDRSADWIASRFALAPGKQVADFGCGPGLYATRLSRTGAEVTGIDFSGRSIRHAQEAAVEEGLTIRYVNQDYLEFSTADRYDLILMIMCDFCALSPDQRLTMLEKFNSLLKPDGSVLLDVYSLKAFDQREEAATYEKNQLHGFWSPDEYYGFLSTFKYEAEKVVLDKYTLIEDSRTRTVYNWLQHFSPKMLEEEFSACGFTVEKIYSDVAGTAFDSASTEFAIVAGRR